MLTPILQMRRVRLRLIRELVELKQRVISGGGAVVQGVPRSESLELRSETPPLLLLALLLLAALCGYLGPSSNQAHPSPRLLVKFGVLSKQMRALGRSRVLPPLACPLPFTLGPQQTRICKWSAPSQMGGASFKNLYPYRV